AAEWRAATWAGAGVRRVAGNCGSRRFVFCCGRACQRAWRADVPELFAGIHAVEEADGVGDVCRRISGRDSADDWLGCGYRFAGSWSVAAVWHFVFVAVSPLLRDFVDVPRGLRTRGNYDAAGGGPRGDADVPADHSLCGGTRGSEFAAGGAGFGGHRLLLWGFGGLHGAAASLPVGSEQ